MATSDAARLLPDLPDDVLASILASSHLAASHALCALSCVSKRFAGTLALSTFDHVWRPSSASCARQPSTLLTWRGEFLYLTRTRHALKPFAMQPPASSPQKLRCAFASALVPHCSPRGSSHGMAPLTTRERAWIQWFGRMQDGVLHLGPCRFDATATCGTALHLHDTATDECIACAFHEAGGGCGLAFAATGTGCVVGNERLMRAVAELRHRVHLVQRLHVVDGTKEPGKRALAVLHSLPRCLCKKLELELEGCPPGALAELDGPADDSATNTMPAVVIAEQARLRLSIGHAMDVVGSLIRQLVRHDAQCLDAASRVQHIVLVAAGRAAAETLQRAVCSIAFKSNLSLLEDGRVPLPDAVRIEAIR